MPVYEASSRSTLVTATAGAVLFGFRAGAARRAYVREIHLFNITAPTTSGALGLVRSSTAGTTSATAVGLPRDPGDPAGTGAVVTNWTLLPTTGGVGTTLRRFTSPASFGNGVIWTFDGKDLVVPTGGSVNGELCFINLQATAPGTYDFTCVFEE